MNSLRTDNLNQILQLLSNLSVILTFEKTVWLNLLMSCVLPQCVSPTTTMEIFLSIFPDYLVLLKLKNIDFSFLLLKLKILMSHLCTTN